MLPKRKRRSDKLIIYLDDGQRDRVERLRRYHGLRSWNETIRHLIEEGSLTKKGDYYESK